MRLVIVKSIIKMSFNSRIAPLIKKIPSKNVNPAMSLVINRNMSDVITHTGQKWEEDDYRLVRFMNSPKQVNNNWAVKMIAEIKPVQVSQRVVWCDGGSGPEGHPRVYINLDKPGDHSCGYCGLRFEKISCH